MAADTVLCKKLNIRVSDYLDMLQNQDRNRLIEFIRERFTERSVTPVEAIPNKPEDMRNGFCTMAISCSMIEALASFWKGRPETPRGDGRATFRWFFEQNENVPLANFKAYGGQFYEKMRCGILHQGETTGGWKVRRDGDLFDIATLTINATKFHRALADCLDSYCEALKADTWDGPVWLAFKCKMNSVCQNC
jgi:hypothetical protein